MKISVIGTRGYPSFYGGFETAVRELAPFFANSGNQTTVYSRRGSCQEILIGDQVDVVYTPYLKFKSLETITHVISSFLHLLFHKPDIILGFNVTCGLVAPFAKLFGIPIVINVDGLEWRRKKWNKFAKIVYFLLAHVSSRFMTRGIADSRHIQEYWARTFGVKLDFISYGGREFQKNELIDEGFSSDLLYVARFVPENSFELFLNVVDALPETVDVKIIGSFSQSEDPLRRSFNSFLNRNPNVKHLGHISNDQALFKFWANSKIYFHGHTVGGTNPALVQAMHCGANILAHDNDFNREVLGDAGNYFGADTNVLKSSILDSIKHSTRANPLHELAQARARSHYSWNDVNKKYLELLKSFVTND